MIKYEIMIEKEAEIEKIGKGKELKIEMENERYSFIEDQMWPEIEENRSILPVLDNYL